MYLFYSYVRIDLSRYVWVVTHVMTTPSSQVLIIMNKCPEEVYYFSYVFTQALLLLITALLLLVTTHLLLILPPLSLWLWLWLSF